MRFTTNDFKKFIQFKFPKITLKNIAQCDRSVTVTVKKPYVFRQKKLLQTRRELRSALYSKYSQFKFEVNYVR
jgi:hypothetical protein